VPIGWSLPNIEYIGLHGCIGPCSKVAELFCTHHSESKLGRSERVQLFRSLEAERILQSYAVALGAVGWRGPFNIQLGETLDGDILAFEVNGRFTGSSATLGALGLHFVLSAIASFLGQGKSELRYLAEIQRVDKRLRDWPMSNLAIDSLIKHGVWTDKEE
jgi:carbamoylphosphate synthase large subunit